MTHQQKHVQRTTKFEEMGMATLLPGMIYAHEQWGKFIEEFKERLRRVQARNSSHAGDDYEPGEPDETPARKTGSGSAQAAYWARMTPKQRSKEMKRRGMVGRSKKSGAEKRVFAQPGELTKRGTPAKMHPRDPRHPGHDAYIAKLRKSQRKYWDGTSPEERKARYAANRSAA